MPAERLSWCATTEPTPLQCATTTESMQKITNEAGKILHATSKTTQPKSVINIFLKNCKGKSKTVPICRWCDFNVKNLKESTKQLLELTNSARSTHKNCFYTLAMNNPKKKLKKTNPFTTARLGKDSYIKNYKTGASLLLTSKESACQGRRPKFNPWSSKTQMPQSS